MSADAQASAAAPVAVVEENDPQLVAEKALDEVADPRTNSAEDEIFEAYPAPKRGFISFRCGSPDDLAKELTEWTNGAPAGYDRDIRDLYPLGGCTVLVEFVEYAKRS